MSQFKIFPPLSSDDGDGVDDAGLLRPDAALRCNVQRRSADKAIADCRLFMSLPVVELCSVTVDHMGDDTRHKIGSASAHTDVSGTKRGNASMEGVKDSASAAEMTFNDEGVQPVRHPSMTLIKIKTQGRFYQSLLAGAGSRGLQKHLLVSVGMESICRVARFCALLSAWPRVQPSDAESSRG